MKLVAVWAQRYAKIFDQGFNLGSSLTYQFDFNIERKELIISAIDTPDFYDLFGGSSITNLTGLIGMNGSGKTTFLQLLSIIENKSFLEFPVILIFEDIKTKIIHIVYYGKVRPENKISIIVPDTGPVSKKSISNKTLILETKEDPLSSHDLLFYSNLYSDQNDKYLSMKNDLNRSVNYQTIQALNYDSLNKYLKNYKHRFEQKELMADEGFNVLKLYFNQRTHRQIIMYPYLRTENLTG